MNKNEKLWEVLYLKPVLNPFSLIFRCEQFKRWILPPEIYDATYVSQALNAINVRWPEINNAIVDPSKPVFVLAAGWGSGSTLVQRIVMSSKEILVWGEPYDIAAPVHRIANMISPVTREWPPESHFKPGRSVEELSKEWVANLAPPIENVKRSHLAFFNSWLGDTNINQNVARWGLKEVRLTIDHARYLKWLFPNARFLFVYRDLFPCYLGCRRRKDWFSIWPHYRATNVLRFAHHWQHLVTGFLEGYKDVDGLLIKYEDLVSGKLSLREIRDYLRVESLDFGILEKKVGSRGDGRIPLILPERILLDSVASSTRRELGYK